MTEYLRLLQRVLQRGQRRASRAGPTLSVFGESLQFSMCNSFPLITTREMFYKPVFGELAAFLTGSTQLKTFQDMGCNYWDANAEAWMTGQSVVGKIYGYQWRYWNGNHDQLAALMHGLREDPYGRRHLLTTWNPSDLPDMCLPPCHLLAQFYVNGAFLDMTVYMRSVDLCLGLPADMALYGLLLALIGREVGRVPGSVVFFLGDAHIYVNHTEALTRQLERRPYSQPILSLLPGSIDTFRPGDAQIGNYRAHPAIKYALNV